MQGHERPFFARLALGGSIAKAQGCGQRWVFVVKKTEYTPVPELSGAGDLRESALPGGNNRRGTRFAFVGPSSAAFLLSVCLARIRALQTKKTRSCDRGFQQPLVVPARVL